jgi:hypothetical protein
MFFLDNKKFKLYKYIYMNIVEIVQQNVKPLNNINKEYLIVMFYFILLFILDYSGLMNLYDQNFVRRLMNMSRRRDYLTYVKKLKHFSENEKLIIKEISEKIRQKYEQRIGKKLYYLDSNRATFYVYYGKSSQHLWHVDPQNISEIYNVILCVRKKGNISPLQCKDLNDNVTSINFEEGDAAFFNGGTTVHQVPPNDDDNSERTVLSIAFTTNLELSKNKNNSNNMCTYIEGGNNYTNMLKLVLAVFIINYIISKLVNINDLSYRFLSLFVVIVLLVVKYVPLELEIGLGSGRSSSISNNLLILLIVVIFTYSLKGGVLFISYFMLSDVFFPSSWVAYD